MRRVLRIGGFLVSIATLLAGCSSARTSAVSGDAPRAMAAAGDSMTRAFNVGACCAWSDAPSYSWATGDEALVNSHYNRLLRLNPGLREFNFAKTGAKMADLERQLRGAGAQHVDYLTILMGSNDLLGVLQRTKTGCTVNPSAMTSVSTFRTQFRRALTAFTALRPTASILVASIPDIPRLWSIFSGDKTVLTVWDRNGSCERLIQDHARSDAGIRAAAARLAAYNQTLGTVCATFKRCKTDGGAVFRFPFQRTDFSEVDYFHPNATGQRRIADLMWRAGYWA
jgi:lysophospholipase L1-like esterase